MAQRTYDLRDCPYCAAKDLTYATYYRHHHEGKCIPDLDVAPQLAGGEIADVNGEGDGVPAGGEHMHGAMEDPADVNIIDAHSEGQGTAMSEDSAAARSSSQQSAEAPSDSSEEEEGMWAGSEGSPSSDGACP